MWPGPCVVSDGVWDGRPWLRSAVGVPDRVGRSAREVLGYVGALVAALHARVAAAAEGPPPRQAPHSLVRRRPLPLVNAVDRLDLAVHDRERKIWCTLRIQNPPLPRRL